MSSNSAKAQNRKLDFTKTISGHARTRSEANIDSIKDTDIIFLYIQKIAAKSLSVGEKKDEKEVKDYFCIKVEMRPIRV